MWKLEEFMHFKNLDHVNVIYSKTGNALSVVVQPQLREHQHFHFLEWL